MLFPAFRKHAFLNFAKACFTTKTVLVMKLTVILIFIACMQVSAKGFGQLITINLKDVSLERAFKEIKQQSGYDFIYVRDQLKKASRIDLNIINGKITQVLETCFKNQPLTYTIEGNYVVIKNKENDQPEDIKITNPVIEQIQGLITDQDGNPLAGVSVMIKGTNTGTQTDNYGIYELKNIEETAILSFTFVGYDPQEISVKNRKNFSLQLKAIPNSLDATVIKGYYNTTKRFNTGNVGVVKAAEIEKQPVTNPLSALQGRVAGLVITQTTGVPGGAINVQIRGQNSIASGNDPFFVVDGVPFNAQMPGNMINGSLHNGSTLNFINPLNIESIEILKDADATAIYGSRAANGAILITTKKGKGGPMKVDFNFSYGFTRPARDLDLLNTQQYLAVRHEAFNNDGFTPGPADHDVNGDWDSTRYTNWSKVLIKNRTQYLNAQTSISGGNANTQYIIGFGYNRQTTGFPRLIPGDGADQNANGHFNITSRSANNKFKITLTGTYGYERNTAQSEDFSQDRLTFAPDAPAIYNPDGSLNWAPLAPGQSGTWTNPFSYLMLKYRGTSSNLLGNLVLSYTVWKDLELKASLGYNNASLNEFSGTPTTFYDPAYQVTSGGSVFSSASNNTWIFEPQINYKTRIGKGTLSALVGASFNEENSQSKTLNATGFNSDALLENIQAASSIIPSANYDAQYKYSALFGRLSYSWQDKYILNLTARRDGSSRFGPGKQFGDFGSIGAAWIFTNENFMKDSRILSFGKLRASYGTTGNDKIGDYQFLDLYQTNGFTYQGLQGLYPGGLYNPVLAWEIDKKLEAGLELGFLKDRINFSLSYYRNRSNNQLLNTSISVVSGFGNILANRPALVQNSGAEIVLNTINIKSQKFTWTSSFNISIVRNKLVNFPDLENSPYADFLVVGKSISTVHLYNYIGVNNTTGLYQFKDSKGNATYTPDLNTNIDKTVLLDLTPKYYGGLQNTFEYKGIEFGFFFQFIKQTGKTLAGSYQSLPGSFTNLPVSFLDRWQKPGDKAPYQKLSQDYSGDAYRALNIAQQSNFAYGDASFIRLKNISLSWQLPAVWKQKLHMQNCRIYINAQNIFTITSYKGLDPETQGIGLPPQKVWAGGFQLSF